MKSISIKHPNLIVSTPKSSTLSDSSVAPQVSLTGVVERITFHSQESGYTVARLQIPRAHDLITIVGNFANIQAGQTLQLQGTWKEHLQYCPGVVSNDQRDGRHEEFESSIAAVAQSAHARKSSN